jgi:hypothetical protein
VSLSDKINSGHVFIQNEGNGKFLELSPDDRITVHCKDFSFNISPAGLKHILDEASKLENSSVSFKVINNT